MKKSLILIVMFLAGCSLGSQAPNDSERLLKSQAPTRDNVDKLMVVDCLLPGQVRSLGQATNYVTARRPVKTSALDCEIRGGEYVAFDRADYATALKIWMPQAQAGDPEAQTRVGEIYEKGMGVEADFEFAALWYKKAAQQGYSSAQINLGYLYEKGLGVEQDIATAMNWYRKASGLPDEVAYISSVELSSKQKELVDLRGEVQRLDGEINEYRKKLNHAERKLKKMQDEKSGTQQDIDSLSQRVSVLQKALDESKKQSTEVVEVPVVSSAIGAGPKKGKSTVIVERMPPKEVQFLISKLYSEIKQKEINLQKQGLVIAKLSQESAQYRERITSTENMQLALAGPSIELMDPALALTRGRPTVLLRSARPTQEVSGRVDAPAGLKAFTFNDQPVDVQPDKSFVIHVPLTEQEVPVKLVAVDAKDKAAELVFSIFTPEQDKPAAPTLSETFKKNVDSADVGRFFALVIGNNNYQNLPNLKTAINDAKKTAELLTDKYGFNVTLLLDADRYQILSAMNTLRNQLNKQDNLLVYYAGHGDLDRVNDRGYWLPTDADSANTANWISNVAVTDMLNTMPAKHVMVIADSCYSGTMTRTAVPRIDGSIPAEVQDKWLKLMMKSRSRTVLSSGGVRPVLDEGGGDHSIFANAFINALQNNRDILQGYALYREVMRKVSRGSLEFQKPEYAPIKHAGHETGQFLFVPKS